MLSGADSLSKGKILFHAFKHEDAKYWYSEVSRFKINKSKH